MLDDTSANVSVDGSTNWGGDVTVSIQHAMPGQVITPQPQPDPTPAASSIAIDHVQPESDDQPITLTEGGSYPVAHGDTLDSIAAQHNLTPGQLKALNPDIQNQSAVYPGQLLTVEAQPAPAAVAAPAINVGPTQSTYTMANTQDFEKAIHQQLAGWTGAGTEGKDPLKTIFEAPDKARTDTDPLKIQHEAK